MFGKVALTYNNEELQDGYFAQLQRILAIYSIARKYRFGYFHSPIIDIIITQLDNHQTTSEIDKFLKDAKLNLKTIQNCEAIKFDLVKNIEIPTLFNLLKLKILSLLTSKSILVRITNPYRIIEKRVDIYKFANEIISLDKPKITNSNQIVAHIRRGVSLEHVSPGENISRMLNEDYYISVLSKICVDDEENYKLLILTDAPEDDEFYKPILKDEMKWDQYRLYNTDKGIKISGHKFESIKNVFPGEIEINRGGDLIEAWTLMASAPHLIMSRSSMSYVGAVANRSGKIYYPPKFWHKPLKHWVKCQMY